MIGTGASISFRRQHVARDLELLQLAYERRTLRHVLLEHHERLPHEGADGGGRERAGLVAGMIWSGLETAVCICAYIYICKQKQILSLIISNSAVSAVSVGRNHS
jgi:hypothetical protein